MKYCYCGRLLRETIYAAGDDDRYLWLCPHCDRPQTSMTVDRLGGLDGPHPSDPPGAGAKTGKRGNPMGTRSRRCSICAIYWPPNLRTCPQCSEPIWPSKERPDEHSDA